MVVPSTLADRFELEREVAAGGMGKIFRARDRQSGDLVAVKVLTDGAPRARHRFLREAAVLAELQHPSIVRYVAHGKGPDGAAYLVMEWLEGEELSHLLARRVGSAATARPIESPPTGLVATGVTSSDPAPAAAVGADGTFQVTGDVASDATVDPGDESQTGEMAPSRPANPTSERRPLSADEADPCLPLLSIAETLLLGHKLAAALASIHRLGVVHRDIKPSNIFLVNGDIARLKLLDLGAAYRFDDLGRLTRTGHILGTPRYMAPEQVQTHGELTAATDLWALGVVLYQCLTGTPPFRGRGLGPLLASIVLAEPRDVLELRPETPVELASLLMAMFTKDPRRRLQDAAKLADALHAMWSECSHIGDCAQSKAAQSARAPSLTAKESRITCMLFASSRVGTLPSDVLERAARSFRGQVRKLLDGTALLTVEGQHSPTEQASLAARMALAVNSTAPRVTLVLATSRTEGESSVHQVAHQAVDIGRRARQGAIRLDEMSASLLETRFHISRNVLGIYLGEERVYPAARIILGKPTKWLGRRRALGTLSFTLEECVDSECARAVLVVAAGGMGKSRLCAEFLERASAMDVGHEVIYGCGDMAHVGSPFNVLAPAIRRFVGLLPGEPAKVAREKVRARVARTVPEGRVNFVASFLGEMIGEEFPENTHPSLASAHNDPGFRSELMMRAWLEFLRAETARAPVLMIIEDLHWGDLPSVEYIDAALSSLRESPFMLLALARPEVENLFPRLWHKRDLTELRLNPLSAKESGALVRNALGDQGTPAIVDSVVERAAGNPFILEELIRVVARGSDALPETVLAIAQERLNVLDADAKRIMRAASVFGEVFWSGAVRVLLGEGPAFDIGAWLRELEDGDFILRQPTSRFSGEPEFRFEHSLIHDAAYALLTDEDRQVGHALAGDWLEQVGEKDASLVAEHLMRGDQPKRAISHLCRAAESAHSASDYRGVIALVEKAVDAGAEGADLGRLHLVHASASSWLGDYNNCREHGLAAAAIVANGSAAWFMAMGHAVVASYRLGDAGRGRELTVDVQNTACESGAEDHQIIGLCRAGFQEFYSGRMGQAERIRAQVAQLIAEHTGLDKRTVAQSRSMLALRASILSSWSEALRHSDAAFGAFQAAGDVNNALVERVSKIHFLDNMGCYQEACDLARELLVDSSESGNRHVATQAKAGLGIALLNLDGPTEEVQTLLKEAMDEQRSAGNRRMEGVMHLRFVELYLEQKDYPSAELAAVQAVELVSSSRPIMASALALQAMSSLFMGHHRDALLQAESAYQLYDEIGGSLHREAAIYYALMRSMVANGQHDSARSLSAMGANVVQTAAHAIDDLDRRQAFLAAPYNRRVLELHRKLSG